MPPINKRRVKKKHCYSHSYTHTYFVKSSQLFRVDVATLTFPLAKEIFVFSLN